ncbi:hypothetical protein PEC301653_32510 [Pectobacterium carotovorum subsp. carotovorum]|uniref:hypothetical protein n=1 Tax=Pectobacterium carotovorum TaxID=554 RepID=UPI00027E1039|nr:hypothetical protein [Pectobacterium carotovorum]AFR03571.1 hypothetical protein PCC21_021680 [Pectobacterium carotovorum subsp. carotovorum PCC21]GKW00206.1 hypothetical protein PEC301653_32510 [Pectobacterium carotovorum subsp. carotovorum]
MDDSFPVTLEQWNAELVKIVFLESSHTGSTLSRIDTTGRIFEQLAGPRSKEDAKRSFLASFGKEASKIQAALKDESRLDILAQLKGYPTYFAILYLTLLAASADDDTHDEGNFRVRFSVLLGFDKKKEFIFTELPNLWERLERWSSRKQNCTRLVLPEPSKNERLIGYSKRIAFPCYKDEVFLRDILVNNALDSHSTFESVNRLVHQYISCFGEVFNQEFIEFRTLLSKAAMQQAYDSPFWGAVRDITVHTERKQLKENGKYCIHMEFNDSGYPEIYLLMDDAAVTASEIQHYYSLPNEIENYNNIYYEQDIGTTLNTLDLLLKKRKGYLYKSRVGAALRSGCLPLFRDDFCHISSEGENYDNSSLYLILHHKYADSIFTALKKTDERAQRWDIKSTKWSIVSSDKVDRQTLDKIVHLLPEEAHRFLIQGWRPARPRMSGAARFGQSILLNPASTPIIHMSEVLRGCYVISNKDGEELTHGSLSQGAEGLFISPEELMGISGQAFCRYKLTLAYSDIPINFDVHVLDHAPYATYRKITEPHDWLIDGPSGVLMALEDTAVIPPLKREEPMPLSGAQMLWQYENGLPVTCQYTELHNIPAAFDWIAEALALRFQRRSTLPFGELKKHIEPVSQVTRVPEWQLRRMLFAAGWLCVVQRRHAPYPLVSLAERTISVDVTEQGIVARILGMFTRSERNLLQEALNNGERIGRRLVEDNGFSMGCIELHLSARERVHAFIEQFGLRLVNHDDLPANALSGVLLPSSQMQFIPTLPPDLYVSLWQAEKYQWSEEQRLTQTANNLLIRCQEKQRYRYFIRQNAGYWQTDSFSWALMAQMICTGETFGVQKGDSDWCWSTKIIALPPSVLQWWTHVAHGCLSITDNGGYLFAGGKVPLWNNVITFPSCSRALARRSRALITRKLRRTLQ